MSLTLDPPRSAAVVRDALAFTVYGLPAPQGSKKHVGNGVMIDDNRPTLRTWREDVKLAALRALEESPDWDRQYRVIGLHAMFTFPRPKSHFRTGKFAHLLRPDAPGLHSTKPDLDKLLRATGDALTAAGVYADDCRIARYWSQKHYVAVDDFPAGAMDRPGVRLRVNGMDA